MVYGEVDDKQRDEGNQEVHAPQAGEYLVAQPLHEVVEGAGILFPHQDSNALAKVLLELKQNKSYYDKVASACFDRANKYDIENTVNSYESLYKYVLNYV